MKVIPVMDILEARVVHAVKGNRDQYEPIQSELCPVTDPELVAKCFQNLGFSMLYIADLDAIMHEEPHYSLYSQLMHATDSKLLLDTGINSLEQIQTLTKTKIFRIIIGSETVSNVQLIQDTLHGFSPNQITFSVDTRGTQLLFQDPTRQNWSPKDYIEYCITQGAQSFILLDLLRVGATKGIRTDLVSHVLKEYQVEVITGGGVSSISDLEQLENLGVSGALVATALHKGLLRPNDLKDHGYL